MRACGAFLSLRVLVPKCMRASRGDVFLVATLNLFVIFTRYRMPPLAAFSCRPSVSSEPFAARMPLLILWLSPTGYCCRERQNSLFVLEYMSSRVWFLYSNTRSNLVCLRRTRTRYYSCYIDYVFFTHTGMIRAYSSHVV